MKKLTDYIFQSDFENAIKLLESGADINAKYGSGIYPIDAAINSDEPKTLEFVIQNGADVNIEYGLPLIIALDYCIDGMIQNERTTPYPEALEMVKILIANGASFTIKDKKGLRPILVLKAYATHSLPLKELKNMFRSVIENIDDII